jgi:para-nitrobenzyl esterase
MEALMKTQCIGLLFSIVCLSLAAPVGGVSDEPLTLDSGQISGAAADPEVMVYKGIPYAAPPVGDLRWRAPQPVKAWAGVRAATAFGPQCVGRSFGAAPVAGESEDCLYLNVWTPAHVRGKPLPVLVWIHGGGFQGGSGSEASCDGVMFAKQGVVVVTINYRVSVFGFLAHPELTKESEPRSSGNYGLLDQVAALQWVKRNIAAFGADPTKVTIAGESAGAYSVSALTASPLARGLFQHAIAQSGGYLTSNLEAMRALDTAERIGADFAQSLGAADIVSLRGLSADELKRAAMRSDFFAFTPCIDGRFLQEPVSLTYIEGRQARAPLLIGSNTDEGAFLIPENRPSIKQFDELLEKTFGQRKSQVRRLYPVAPPAALIRSELDLSGDAGFNYPMWKWAMLHRQAGLPVYYYLFGRTVPATPGHLYKGIPRTAIGAFHGDEVAYVFGSLDGAAGSLDGLSRKTRWENTDRKLSAAMLSYWANFIKTGDPNGQGAPAWPRYEANANNPLMHFNDRPQVKPDKRTARMKALDSVFQTSYRR